MGIIAGVLFTVPAYRPRSCDADGNSVHPVLDRARGPRGDRPRHAVGRVADHPHDGDPHHQAAACARIRRRDGAAGAVFLATVLGIPVSTTHAITGAIVGVGATRRLSAVRWGVAGQHRLGVAVHDSRRRAHRRGDEPAAPGVRDYVGEPAPEPVRGRSRSSPDVRHGGRPLRHEADRLSRCDRRSGDDIEDLAGERRADLLQHPSVEVRDPGDERARATVWPGSTIG